SGAGGAAFGAGPDAVAGVRVAAGPVPAPARTHGTGARADLPAAGPGARHQRQQHRPDSRPLPRAATPSPCDAGHPRGVGRMTLLAELARLLRLMDPIPPRILSDAEAAGHLLRPVDPMSDTAGHPRTDR